MRAFFLGLLLASVPHVASAAPVMNEPGWTISHFATLSAVDAPEVPGVDAGGNLYVPRGIAGVYRFTPEGVGSLWSSAPGYGIAVLPNGEAYLPSRDVFATKYMWHILSDGSYLPLVSAASPSWLYADATPDGRLFASVIGVGRGIYQIDTQTGLPMRIVNGGPGPSGTGRYWDLASTSDGTVYVSASLVPDRAIFRIDVAQDTCTRVLTVPETQLSICRGPADTLYGASFHSQGLSSQGEVWKLDVTGGTASVFASGFEQSYGIIYDAGRDRFYVVEQTGLIWSISRNTTPTTRRSWGSVKAQYR